MSIVTIFLLLLMLSQSLWADVRATLSRQSIQEGDSVSLDILVTNSDAADPDLSVLQKDFEILGTGSSQQTSIINGRRSSSRQWHIELLPKRLGELTVPPVTVGKQSTAALSLSVTAQPAAAVAQAGEPVFVETAIASLDEEFYVQQQIRYTLKLYYRERLYDGSFDGPHVDNALVERLGDDKQYQTSVNGQQYQVVERRYAIFPEQSGILTLPPVTFSGRLADQSRQRMPSTQMSDMMERFFGNSGFSTPGKQVRLRGESYTLNILPRPAGYSGQHWLPGEKLVLVDSWAEGPPEFSVGEPVSRTLTLEVKGLESTHLPEFHFQDSDSMRRYPEKPVYSNRTDGEWIYGRMEQTITYVPAIEGMQTIPAIKLDWWDTGADQQRTAELPAWTINVAPGDGVSNIQQPPAQEQTAVDKVTTPAGDHPPVSEPDEQSAFKALLSPWVALAAAAVLALLAMVIVSRIRRRGADRGDNTPQLALRTARTAVREACRSDDASLASKALLQWAAVKWPDDPPRNLGALARRMSGAREHIEHLGHALYSNGAQAWQGEALLHAFDRDRQTKSPRKTAKRGALSPLYPDWKT